LPYWDWARPTDNEITLFPKEVWSTEVHKVIRPGSNNTPTDLQQNPLAGYKFGDVGRGDANIDLVSVSIVQTSASAGSRREDRDLSSHCGR
jgi:hypothetical protein